MVWLDAFNWNMSRNSLETSLQGRFIGDSLTNAIGLPGHLYGIRSFLMLYFSDRTGVPTLSRLTLTFETSSVREDEIEALYARIRNDAVLSYAIPLCVDNFDESDPSVLRYSEKLTWVRGDIAMALSIKRVCDGFSKEQAGVFMFAGDINHDPIAALSVGCWQLADRDQ